MSIKILLADDSITIQKVISIIFGGEEYVLTVVDNGKAAIEKAREVLPDVMLIDVLMPGMSGYDVCEAIRATPELSALPLLLLTGTFEPFDEEKAKNCGADDFLAKPFESQQIVNKVKELFELGASRAVAAPQAGTAPEPFPFDTPLAPPVEKPSQTIEADDIWGAFTAAPEPGSASIETAAPEPLNEPDVFAIISEEPPVKPEPPMQATTPAEGVGSDWIPVDEHTFEFEEEAVAEIPATSITGLQSPDQEVSFGDISFTDVLQPEPVETAEAQKVNGPPVAEEAFIEPSPFFAESIVPDFSEPVVPAFDAVPGFEDPKEEFVAVPNQAKPNEAFVDKTVEAAPAALTEAQLRAAIAGVSQEVIERIVWEVVPDMAETLIKEAIRKIKEGL